MMKINEWIPCSDNNYWSEEDGYVTIVKFIIDDKWEVFTQECCPYGWNVLCDLKAELMNIKL